MRKVPVGIQVLIALVLGAVLGWISKPLGLDVKVLGDAFIRLIQMSILPLVFPLIVLGVARMESIRKLGRIAGKTILYFEIVTTLILLLGVLLANLTSVGSGTAFADISVKSLSGFAQGIDFKTFLLDIIPKNLFDSLAKGSLLSVVFFALFFGLAMASIADRAKPVADFLESLSDIMFEVIRFVVRFAPIGVFGFIAFDVASYGWSSIQLLGQFVTVAYIGFLLIFFVVFPLVALLFKVKYFELIKEIWDLLLLAFTTRSSEVVLAPLMTRLNRYGVHNSVTSFVLPLGYSFNLDGATLYESIAVLFLAHAYGIHLTVFHQLEIIGTLMILTKGLAGVPSAAVVVLLATAKAISLPTEGIALLLGVDFIVDMARTAVNVAGNSLAAVVIAKTEKLFHAKSDRLHSSDT